MKNNLLKRVSQGLGANMEGEMDSVRRKSRSRSRERSWDGDDDEDDEDELVQRASERARMKQDGEGDVEMDCNQGRRRRKLSSNSNTSEYAQARLPEHPSSPSSPDAAAFLSSASSMKRNSLPGLSVHDLAISSPKPVARSHHLPHPIVDVTPATPTSPVQSESKVSSPSNERGRTRLASKMGINEITRSVNDIASEDASTSCIESPICPSSPVHSPFPRRSPLPRLRSQVIADSPTNETPDSPSTSPHQESPPSRRSAPRSSSVPYTKSPDTGNDYRFPTVQSYSLQCSDDDHLQPQENGEDDEKDYSMMVTSPQSENGTSSLEPDAAPARGMFGRKNSGSSVHSSQSINEYSTPSGFLKHRRTSSMNAPKEVKESYNAGCKELPNGKRKLNQYVLTHDIGKGSFGIVQLAKDEDSGKEFAVKEFSKMRLRKRQQSEMIRRQGRGGARRGAVPIRRQQPGRRNVNQSPERTEQENGKRDLDLIRSEVAIMKKLDHPNVVKLYEVLDIQEDDSLFMVVELCGNGPLMTVGMGQTSEPMGEEDTRNYFRQIVLAIEYLHYNGIIHRDIKPENILKMSDPIDAIKVCDFGVSEMFTKEDADNPHVVKAGGSPAFMSPELCISNVGKISGKAADIWALGVTLYCMLVGHLPFEAQQMLDLYDQIKNEPVKIPKELNEDLKDLLRRMLEKNPDARIKIKELRDHDWLTLHGHDPLPSTDVNVSNLAEVTEQDVREAIGVPSVSYIVNAVRAASRWKRYAARRSSTASSIGSSNLSRSGSMELASSEMCCTASRNGSMESRRTSIETTSPQGITPASSMATEALSSDDSSPAPWTQSQSYSGNSGYNQDLHTAASFPMSATKNEKGGLPHSAYDFAEMTSMKSHADHLNMGIDDSNVEAVRYYEDQTGHYMPRDAVTSRQHKITAGPIPGR